MNRIHLFAVAIVFTGSVALWSSHNHDSRKPQQTPESLVKATSSARLPTNKLALAVDQQKRQ